MIRCNQFEFNVTCSVSNLCAAYLVVTTHHDALVHGVWLFGVVRAPVVQGVVEVVGEPQAQVLELSVGHHRTGRTGGDGRAFDGRDNGSLVLTTELLQISQTQSPTLC